MTNPNVPTGCVTVTQAAAALGMSRASFDAKVKDGTLTRLGLIETNRIDHRRFFVARSLNDVLFRRRTGGARARVIA